MPRPPIGGQRRSSRPAHQPRRNRAAVAPQASVDLWGGRVHRKPPPPTAAARGATPSASSRNSTTRARHWSGRVASPPVCGASGSSHDVTDPGAAACRRRPAVTLAAGGGTAGDEQHAPWCGDDDRAAQAARRARAAQQRGEVLLDHVCATLAHRPGCRGRTRSSSVMMPRPLAPSATTARMRDRRLRRRSPPHRPSTGHDGGLGGATRRQRVEALIDLPPARRRPAHGRSRATPCAARAVTRRRPLMMRTSTSGCACRFSHHAGSPSPHPFIAMVTMVRPVLDVADDH